MIYLDGHSLTLENLVAVARGGTPVALADAARAVVNEYAHHDDPAYGINTGFGHVAEVKIPAESLSQLQIHDFMRSRVSAIEHDRSFSPDLRIISDMIVSGARERSCGLDVN